MVIELMLCPTCQTRLLEPLDSRRTIRTNDTGATIEGSKRLEAADEAVAVKGEAVVGLEGKAVGAPMDHSSM